MLTPRCGVCRIVKLTTGCMTGKRTEPLKDMVVFSQAGSKVNRAWSVLVIVVYLTVALTIELFHDDNCPFAPAKSHSANAASTHQLCPVCMFCAGFNSTEPEYAPALIDTESVAVYQSVQHWIIADHSEWACSIVSRAPPPISTS